MNCSNCGTDMAGNTRCAVCGHALALNAGGTLDPVTGLMLAGWWRRVGATLSDELILAVPTLMVLAAINPTKHLGLTDVCLVVINGLYTIPLLSGERGQTVGNRVASSRVRAASSGQRVTLDQVVRRWAFMMFFGSIGVLGSGFAFVGGAVALVDYLYPLFDARNQTLHDKFAGTIVVLA